MIIYRGPSMLDGSDIVAVLTPPGKNRKIGKAWQLWIMPANQNPLAAYHSGTDKSVCGNCPVHDSCYVVLIHGPMGVWRKFKRRGYGHYRPHADLSFLATATLRLGAWGDPAALPDHVLERLVNAAATTLGYSHQLFSMPRQRADKLAQWLMCSIETPA